MRDRLAIVTGAGSERGIGKAVAYELAKRGATVVIADMNKEGADQVAAGLQAEGYQASSRHVDVTNRASVNAMIDSVIAEFGKIDILINNAGITRPSRVLEISEEEWDLIFAVNMKGVFNCTQAVLPSMIEHKYGRIVNLSSVSAKRGGGVFGGSHYSAAKAGVLGFAKAVAREVAGFGITVNSVTPGLIDTDITGGLMTPELKEKAHRDIPAGRSGTAQEVAYTIAFLASEGASYITGEEIDINGGSHID